MKNIYMHNDKECIRTKITLISRRTPTIIFLHCFSHRGWEGQWVACAIGLTCIHSSSLISLLRGAIKRWLSFYIRCTRSFPVDNVNYNFPLPPFYFNSSRGISSPSEKKHAPLLSSSKRNFYALLHF